jgi:hypothetical protein
MDPHRRPSPIPLYPNPPLSPRPTHESSDSDFPPIRIHKSSPDPPVPSASNHSRPRRSPAVPGQRDLNTMVRQAISDSLLLIS